MISVERDETRYPEVQGDFVVGSTVKACTVPRQVTGNNGQQFIQLLRTCSSVVPNSHSTRDSLRFTITLYEEATA